MSGVIHPGEAPRDDPARSEGKVWRALRDVLPDDWIAWHSLRLRDAENVFLEGDFVIAAPEFGLLALEVKGGRVELRDGRWLQNGAPLKKPPLRQALDFVHALERSVRAKGLVMPPFGAAVLFPDCEFSQGPDAADVAGVVLGEQDLPYLDAALRAVAANAVRTKRAVPPLSAWTPTIGRLWGEHWVPVLATAKALAEGAERRLLRLNERQIAILDATASCPKAVVSGAAGTGKSLLARELCARRAAGGKRVLYLCFTRALAAALRTDLEKVESAAVIRATTIRQLAFEILTAAGHPVAPQEDAFWEEASFRAAEVAEGGAGAWDLVAVDEAQDLAAGDWALVEVLARGADVWAFLDERQRFWEERALPDTLFAGAAQISLPDQERSPPALETFAARYASPAVEVAEVPPGTPTDVVRVVRVEQDSLADEVGRQVAAWIRGGARPSDVAVVTLAGRTKSDLLGLSQIGGQPVVPAEDCGGSDRVVADTFLRFKGFERPFVVVTELGGDERRDGYDTRMYIALTRATAQAVVVATDTEIRQDPRLAALAGDAP